MDIERLLQLFVDGDASVWADLYREIERRGLGQDVINHAQNWNAGPARSLVTDILSGDFRLIPAGECVIGPHKGELEQLKDETQYLVEISRPFLLKTTPVTQGEWLALMGNNPSHFSSNHKSCPVETVSWFDAVAYCNALSKKEGLTRCYDLSSCTGTPGTKNYKGPDNIACDFACNGYRLPTEAEWEYAAHAGSTTAFYNGVITEPLNRDPSLEQLAWYRENSGSKTHPVKGKQPNAWGLYDMLGNVWEWCQDWYKDYPSTPQRDPSGPPGGSGRVMRGGSWNSGAGVARATYRNGYGPSNRFDDVGLRPARSNF